MPNIIPPSQSLLISIEGKMTDWFRAWTQDITRLDLIVGTGSPEGVVSAEIGREYMDDAGTAGSIKYIKQKSDIAGDSKDGWILI